MGNLFSRKQPISSIMELKFCELKMWNFWHEKMSETERKYSQENGIKNA